MLRLKTTEFQKVKEEINIEIVLNVQAKCTEILVNVEVVDKKNKKIFWLVANEEATDC